MTDRICPKCNRRYTGYPAISRRDSTTEICSTCGVIEALEDFGLHTEQDRARIMEQIDAGLELILKE